MPGLTLTDDLCTRCGSCAHVCPLGIIHIPEPAGGPRYSDNGAERCIICGHCEAVCPTGALTLHDPRLAPNGAISTPPVPPEALDTFMRMRRSIRRFRQEPVPREVLERLLDVTRHAPTGSNRQGVKWLVVHDTGRVRHLTELAVEWLRSQQGGDSILGRHFNVAGMIRSWERGKDPICRNAPHLVIPFTDMGHPTATVDAVIAATHLDIVASAHGLGTCWCGFFQMAAMAWEPLKRALDLPEGHIPGYTILLGYPAVTYHRPPRRNRLQIVWR